MESTNHDQTAASVEKQILRYKQTKAKSRSIFTVVLVLVTALVIAMLFYTSHRARAAAEEAIRSQALATKASIQAQEANQRLDVVAAELLRGVEDLDQKAKKVCNCDNPAAYLWRQGLKPHRGDTVDKVDSAIMSLLMERRQKLASSGPLLIASDPLRSYVCRHINFVVGFSLPTSIAQRNLDALKRDDRRFEFAGIAVGPTDPSAAVLVGFFLTPQEVKDLQRAIGVPAFDIHPWDFLQYRPTCPIASH